MTSARYVVGDVHAVLATLGPGSVDLVLTSPPFLALRSYLPADHPDKQHEIGSEPTPGAFIDVLLDVVEACERVLAPHGSMCIELGDTYAGTNAQEGSNGNKTEGRNPKSATGARPFRRPGLAGWPLDKSLCLIPELFRIALVYGHNPLTGRQTPRWRARNVIRWCRPNPPVGALGDKYRPATTDMVVITRNRDRYFDLDAVRQPYSELTQKVHGGRTTEDGCELGPKSSQSRRGMTRAVLTQAGAPPLDWWNIPTEPYSGAHYATWPTRLLETPIDSMTPLRVCRTCGKPSQRIVEVDGLNGKDILGIRTDNNRDIGLGGARPPMPDITRTTVGWSDCAHNNWRTGLVLDPFAGSGTTLAVATGHGRDAIGIDIDPRNAELALDRVGPLLLTVEVLDRAAQSR